MRRSNWVIITALVCSLGGWGCAGSADKALSQNQHLTAIKQAKGYVKKVAMVQTLIPMQIFDRNAANLFFETLSEAIQKENANVQLLTSKSEGFPDFMAALTHAEGPVNADVLARKGRLNGFNGLITTALHSIQVVPYKTGFFWFRKTKYRFTFEVTLDLYDPITGAKVLSILEEGVVKISETVYDDYKQGAVEGLEDVDEVVVDLAEAIGESVAETLAAQLWQASVVQVEGARFSLPAGGQAGLREGQRLAVIDGRRILEGQRGETFIVPGLKIGEATISKVSEAHAEAIADTAGKIKAGDIAIPIE